MLLKIKKFKTLLSYSGLYTLYKPFLAISYVDIIENIVTLKEYFINFIAVNDITNVGLIES